MKAGRLNVERMIFQREAIKGLTQAELAALVGVSEATICQYETGKIEPLPGKFVRLCEALGVEATDMILPNGDK